MRNFYPRSPCGERHCQDKGQCATRYFYPRSPCGERLSMILGQYCESTISIHALLAESDRKARDARALEQDFYPRSPCGERPRMVRCATAVRAFLSTLSLRRATTLTAPVPSCVLVFLSTLSLRRATFSAGQSYHRRRDFYPRSPCGERHLLDADFCRRQIISIHALLAESDERANSLAHAPPQISIHALLAESDFQ